jgi:hypothetical protein
MAAVHGTLVRYHPQLVPIIQLSDALTRGVEGDSCEILVKIFKF